MNSVSILHTADLHIGAQCSYLGTEAAIRRREVLKTFENIINLTDIGKKYQIQIVSIGLRDIMLPIKNEKALSKLKPDFYFGSMCLK